MNRQKEEENGEEFLEAPAGQEQAPFRKPTIPDKSRTGGRKDVRPGSPCQDRGKPPGKDLSKGRERREDRRAGRFGGALRRSDNPDVLVGRDFEEDAIPIEQIVGEMGEVTIRGQIQNMETREIRGEKTIVMLEVTDFTIPSW